MPRPLRGTVQRLTDGRYQAIITLADGSRMRLEPFPLGTSAARAREKAAYYSERAREQGLVRTTGPAASPPAPSDTMATWVAAWLAARRARGLTSVRENDQHWRVHIAPVVGSKHVRHWAAVDLRALCVALDKRVRAGELSWKTAANVWGTATRMCRDACRSKLDTLRCREDDPSRDVEGPDRGARREKQFLYPSEFSRFVACEAIPVHWRRLVAIAVCTYMREGELRALRWDDLDL
ncbi:MAG: hypothetical protein IT373_11990 [Polyangiaceae bacterium]|nr:hypothetical protein [Polyangiaceae bacterium]